MPLPLYRLTGAIFHMAWLALALQQQALGEYRQDPQGTPEPPPQVRALRETSTSMEVEHPELCLGELQEGRGTTTLTQDPTPLLLGK